VPEELPAFFEPQTPAGPLASPNVGNFLQRAQRLEREAEQRVGSITTPWTDAFTLSKAVKQLDSQQADVTAALRPHYFDIASVTVADDCPITGAQCNAIYRLFLKFMEFADDPAVDATVTQLVAAEEQLRLVREKQFAALHTILSRQDQSHLDIPHYDRMCFELMPKMEPCASCPARRITATEFRLGVVKPCIACKDLCHRCRLAKRCACTQF